MQQILSRLRLKSDGLQLECLWGKALSLLIAVMRLSLIGGRSREIRTPDPLVPNQMRYQTALCSEAVHCNRLRQCCRVEEECIQGYGCIRWQ